MKKKEVLIPWSGGFRKKKNLKLPLYVLRYSFRVHTANDYDGITIDPGTSICSWWLNDWKNFKSFYNYYCPKYLCNNWLSSKNVWHNVYWILLSPTLRCYFTTFLSVEELFIKILVMILVQEITALLINVVNRAEWGYTSKAKRHLLLQFWSSPGRLFHIESVQELNLRSSIQTKYSPIARWGY